MTHAQERKKIINLKSPCTIMPLKVGLMFWTAFEGIHLYETNKVLAFETIPQLD